MNFYGEPCLTISSSREPVIRITALDKHCPCSFSELPPSCSIKVCTPRINHPALYISLAFFFLLPFFSTTAETLKMRLVICRLERKKKEQRVLEQVVFSCSMQCRLEIFPLHLSDSISFTLASRVYRSFLFSRSCDRFGK